MLPSGGRARDGGGEARPPRAFLSEPEPACPGSPGLPSASHMSRMWGTVSAHGLLDSRSQGLRGTGTCHSGREGWGCARGEGVGKSR